MIEECITKILRKLKVRKLRSRGVCVVQLDIYGKPTYWKVGSSLGEPVYHSLFNQGPFIKGQRMCEELGRGIMDGTYGQHQKYK